MKSKEVRQRFLDYFQRNGHQVVASSSLIPAEDPTLLFTNAGMNQFKDCFLGKEKRAYMRATTSQKCVRAGGKHNDLENVGFTARHLTFFEMLGNFSFGDYFKKEAITFAWELLTKEYGLPPEKLYVSVFNKDDEAYAIWNTDIGVPAQRIVRLGEKDNFWAMGDTGPCGPCTEIYLDHGKDAGCGSDQCQPGCDCDRFIEIWNNVFMQFNRSADGTLTPLAQSGVDTGMGLERLCAVLQGKRNVFATDIFTGIKQAITTFTGIALPTNNPKLMGAFNVICDHIRSSCLLMADGCSPANDGRGYVLRKIMRRAILFASKLSDKKEFLPTIARFFINESSDIFPELKVSEKLIISIWEQEVERFMQNLQNGQAILAKYITQTEELGSARLSGEHAFKLYDTYGFPLELTKVIAHENNLTVDEEAFAAEMAKQQSLSKNLGVKEEDTTIPFPEDMTTTFTGYETTECTSKVLWQHTTDTHRWLITTESPFYVESGGQVNDEGVVTINKHSYHVVDLKKVGSRFAPAIAVKLEPVETMGACAIGDAAECEVNKQSRVSTVRNHTATHMLHAALHTVLGKQAKQAGSVVNKDYLRFDYTNHEAPSAAQLAKLEQMVNEKIWEDIATNIFNTTLEDAQRKGVIAFFGEKYNPANVRVVTIPGFSQELCGGTHAPRTGIIGAFKIVSDTALATGTRRIVAVTGARALELFQQSYKDIKMLSEHFKVKPEQTVDAVLKQEAELNALNSELRQAKKKLLYSSMDSFAQKISTGTKLPQLFLMLDESDIESMRAICQTLDAQKPGFYFIATNAAGKSQFVAWTSKNYLAAIPHAELMNILKGMHLQGGGRPGLIQGGGQVVTPELVDVLKEWIAQLIPA
ncbi:MAG: alanyl-tRNA synthetase [Candidatus Dependentiae bacterium]|nr:alanyl-tRNA synthetase [Candidatus Dependentiae bacterium]